MGSLLCCLQSWEVSCFAVSWQALSEIAVSGERQVADPLASGCENSIAKSGDKRRYSWFSYTSGGRRALRNVNVGLSRDLVDPCHRIVIKIGLLDYAVLGRNFSAAHDARAKNHRAFELRAGCFRINDQPRIQRGVNTRDADLAVITHLHFNDRSHIS